MNKNPNNEKLRSITFLRGGKYAIHPAWGPIIKYEIGQSDDLPLTFCQDMVDAGAAEWTDSDKSQEKVEKATAEADKDEKEKNKQADESEYLMLEMERIVEKHEMTKGKKDALSDWAMEEYGINANKQYKLKTMMNKIIKEVVGE